ncbi:M42 family metallopeptidase [Legionella spiritensis]|uniref:Endo-1,4 beta-glucanase n=1 Tax=Legionella spiritensis TaxID=452 RepID=A0A0W0Z9W8_LEGSP|nr:M42 family metallopeptidase [Legionella spiritensis]KTD65895.1 endo-1,4 beta-glucanase [Legionella spiritensis]SNV31985.1 endo-1,4 beta-glucanase [Legionella spiritensis]VEG92202.1 endo-1,4 beta-glucanase [Legionella spiritensis]
MSKGLLYRSAVVCLGVLVSVTAQAAAQLPLLAKLTDTPAASGYEKPVRTLLETLWTSETSVNHVDGMGNLISHYKGKGGGPKLLLMAHMDETGFMVESVTPDGFIKVVPLGGIANAVIYAQRWQIAAEKSMVIGYSGMDTPHLLGEKKTQGSPDIKALFLDIGAEDQDDAIKRFGMRPGLAVTPVSKFTQLSDTRFLAKALDDRIGLAIISEVLETVKRNQPAYQLFAAATVQEELGMRGASTVYHSTHPDVVINVEIGIADDYPSLAAERKNTIFLGKGPTVFVYDRSMIPNQALVAWVRALAEKHHIPIQLEAEPGYGEDGSKVQTSGPGVPAINIGVPVRYAHQHAGIFDKRDYNHAVRLLTLIASHFNQDVANQIRQG